ncbi:hypothetical protein BDQ94DRAFT_133444, partial [Aspergillus welwitschiae]
MTPLHSPSSGSSLPSLPVLLWTCHFRLFRCFPDPVTMANPQWPSLTSHGRSYGKSINIIKIPPTAPPSAVAEAPHCYRKE